MVLQDVNDNAPDSFTDNPGPADNDPYSSTSTPPIAGSRFDSSSLPKPIPIVAPLIGFSDRAVRFKAETTLKFAERKLGRYLTAEESQALASHIYQLEQTKSYFGATGAVAGSYRWYNTMSTYRYPFYKPKIEEIDVNKFGPVKGPWANFARQSWRFALYVVVASNMGNIVGQLLAQPLAAQRTSQDPKLEQFGNELKAATTTDARKTQEQGRVIEDRRKEFQDRLQREKRGGIAPPQAGRSPAHSGDDDMSPTAGNEAWGSSASSQGSWGDSELASESTPQRRERSGPREQERVRAPRGPPPSSSDPFDSDASPTGGMFQDEVTNTSAQPQPRSRPGESTWEALRRGARPVGVSSPAPSQRFGERRPQPERKEQREGSTLGDSFTFVEGDEERKMERERAQREFDERIERERQGKDFESGESKKW